MKKLFFVFVVILVIVLVVGCRARRENGEFETDTTTTVVTPVDDEEEAKPLDVAVNASEEGDEQELAVTSLNNGQLETSEGYHLVQGTAPMNTHSIQVNDYTLQHYRPGDSQWRYIASTGIGTLAEGDNAYAVRALDAEGDEIATTSFDIAYHPTTSPDALPGVGTPLSLTFLVTFLLSLGWFVSRRFEF
ncbi:MAG: hypothetical protein V1760_03685 [Candidatus Peregrinibacteria bacterium]